MKVGFRCSEGNDRFRDALRQVQYAEELGFDSVWLSEHHGLDFHWPSPQIALAGFATQTDTIDLGTSIVILPQTNPVRLAGEFNLLDVISGGRAILGVGIGWRRSEMENLDWRFDTRGPRMTDHLRALNELWSEDVASFSGREIAFENVELSPSPVQDPHPPLWVGGRSDQSLRRAARLGDSWFPAWDMSISKLAEKYESYEEYVPGDGDDSSRVRPLVRFAVIEDESRVARERVRSILRDRLEKFKKRNADRIPEPMRDALSGNLQEYADERFIYGDANDCIDQIETYEERLGIDHLILKLYNPGTSNEEMDEYVTRIGESVLPAVQ